ncbi:hypothetical protein [Gibbsiella quercinecans]|uniref:Uncharacterized protein n=1 Tax=Gibbsiella quercinecans TaxID=929813 RepID=A0A250AZL0_9GAMM|nr:hypothetical protein [Gibbsiella quercinecans]ATA19142.1 hypothetical protein AWC35_07140 [Gibbsiella quercinecans]RLM03707.1 hypothetical protein BIY31_20980 [Gibbsiella quercinecans]RLM10964.1 hypothetical protein BIY30_08345 [Gibbsiella quercinecans]
MLSEFSAGRGALGTGLLCTGGFFLTSGFGFGARSSIGGNVWLTRDTPPDSNIRQASLLQSPFKDGDGI